jgi:antitoxin ParD1/3/4
MHVGGDHRGRLSLEVSSASTGARATDSATIDNLCQRRKLSEIAREWRRRPMPTRNVNLTEELDHFVAAKVASGRYENASEVVRASLRALEREEQEYDARLARLPTALEEGEASGDADDYSLEGLIAELDREKTA